MHDLLKIVGNSVSNVQIAFISSYLLRSSLFGITCFWLIPIFDLLVSISDEDSLSEIALSGASKLASTYFTLFYISVHVLYTGLCSSGVAWLNAPPPQHIPLCGPMVVEEHT